MKIIVKYISSCRGCMNCTREWSPINWKYFCARTKKFIPDIDAIPGFCPLDDVPPSPKEGDE